MTNHSKVYPSKTMAKEKQYQLCSYAVSVALTVIAFVAVGTEAIQNRPALVTFIIILAVLQVIFQLTYFMHLKDKGHRYPTFFVLYSVFAAMMIFFGTILWLWW